MRVHRLVSIIDPQPIHSFPTRIFLRPGEDGLSFATEGFKVATLGVVVSVTFEPINGVARDFEGKGVMGYMVDLTGRIEHKSGSVDMLLGAELAVDFPLRIQDPVKPAGRGITHHAIEILDTVMG